jgi:hypothetical protein
LVRWCDDSGSNISTINTDWSAKQAQAPEAGKRAVTEHDVVPATKLFICFKTKTWVACPAVVFHFGNQNRAAKSIEDDQKDDEVDWLLRGVVRRMLWCNEEGEGISKAVVDEFVVGAVVSIFQRAVHFPTDLEDVEQTCGPTIVSGKWHAKR